MNDHRDEIRNKVCFVDDHAYVAGGVSGERVEKFDYKQNKWISLPDYPIKDDLNRWASALTFIPEEIKQETISDRDQHHSEKDKLIGTS